MTTSREAENADTLRVYLPRIGIGAGQTYGSLGVEQRNLMTQPRQAILENDCCNAMLNEPLCNRITLTISDVADLTTAGT